MKTVYIVLFFVILLCVRPVEAAHFRVNNCSATAPWGGIQSQGGPFNSVHEALDPYIPTSWDAQYSESLTGDITWTLMSGGASYVKWFGCGVATCSPPEVALGTSGLCACPVGEYHETPSTCVPDPCAGEPPVTRFFAINANGTSTPDTIQAACGAMKHAHPYDCLASADGLTCSAAYASPSDMEQLGPGGSFDPSGPPPDGTPPNTNPDGTPIAGGGGGTGGTVDCTITPNDPSCPTGGGTGGTVDCTVTPNDPSCPTSGGTGPNTGTYHNSCETHPNSAMCKEFGTPPATTAIDSNTIDVSLNSFDTFTFNGSMSCPPDRFAALSFGSIKTISYGPFCDFVSALRPLVLALAFFIATLVFMGHRSVSDA